MILLFTSPDATFQARIPIFSSNSTASKEKGELKKIRCDFCREFIPPRKIEVFAYGVIDSLHYICNACNNTLNESQKRTVIEDILSKH